MSRLGEFKMITYEVRHKGPVFGYSSVLDKPDVHFVTTDKDNAFKVSNGLNKEMRKVTGWNGGYYVFEVKEIRLEHVNTEPDVMSVGYDNTAIGTQICPEASEWPKDLKTYNITDCNK